MESSLVPRMDWRLILPQQHCLSGSMYRGIGEVWRREGGECVCVCVYVCGGGREGGRAHCED